MSKSICIHGHFYQPPRENPWLKVIEQEDTAYPYHDWNERITAESYAPNSASRILDRGRRIIEIVNNYSKISFNFGPTLLSWMEENAAEAYAAILAADRESRKNFSGHGAAIAQAYNHIILPLANSRDKRTQVRWGIKDFERRFGRKPEGMWLPETAVDTESLEILAEFGIKFTILAPHQAQRVRRIGEERWQEVSGGRIDPRMPYLCNLPSGRSMAIFFYDGPVSRGVAFEKLLESGETLAERLLGAFAGQGLDQLVNIATDGETYGHHHRFGEMALSYCLYQIETRNLARITIYGEHLEKHPPSHEVEIVENSSWSCFHGVERWRGDCGCRIGSNPKWNQRWRAPLRQAMEWLRDALVANFEREAVLLVKDPWAARDSYIDLVLDRSEGAYARFFSEHAARELSPQEKVKTIKLLEMQYYALLMFTSCGWFFDEVSGIETLQVMRYAARAIQLAQETAGIDLEPEYLRILEGAESNLAECENAAKLYEKLIKPEVLDLLRVGAHYAIASLFEECPPQKEVFCYTAQREIYDRIDKGRQKLAVGKMRLRSQITGEENRISFAVLHFGDQNIMGGVRLAEGDGTFEKLRQTLKRTFQKGDTINVVPLIDSYFGKHSYSLWHLFRDEQRKVLNQIIRHDLHQIEASLHQTFDQYQPIMSAMNELMVPLPRALYAVARFVFNIDLRRELEKEKIDLFKLRKIVEEARKWPVKLDRKTLSFEAGRFLNKMMQRFYGAPEEINLLTAIVDAVIIFANPPLELELDLWQVQNLHFALSKSAFPSVKKKANEGDPRAQKWVELFRRLAKEIMIRMD